MFTITKTTTKTAYNFTTDGNRINRTTATRSVYNTETALKTLDEFLTARHTGETAILWLDTYADITLPYVRQYIDQYKRNGGTAKIVVCPEYKGIVTVKVYA